MVKLRSMVLLLGALYLRVCSVASLNASNTDESSLVAIKKHINSEILANNWSQHTSFCSWPGVICSSTQPRVIGLNLSHMELGGIVAAEIGNLSFLTSLDVRNNSLSGSIPAEIGKLRNLRVIDMAYNQFNDSIPTSLSSCTQLSKLELSYNNLTGQIPLAFGNLSHLQHLFFTSNLLTGELPPEIFNISSLLKLGVGENALSGSIPKHICNTPAPNLQDFRLDKNQFEGEIPSALMRCHALQYLALGYNNLQGAIPTHLGNLSNLRGLTLPRSKLNGTIPPSIGNLSKLEILDLNENNLEGRVPQEMGQLHRLTWLALAINNLNGELPQSIFNLSLLQGLVLGSNNLSGYIPPSIDNSLPSIEYIDLGSNRFYGRIPSSVSNLSGLVTFQLSLNSFTGEIPTNLGNLRQLQWLTVAFNQFTNDVSNPEQDFLSSLTNCKYLNVLQISVNPITGVLPKSLGSSNLSASLERFGTDFCRLEGPIPSELGNLTNLFMLYLGGNHFTGVIPATLGHLSNMQLLAVQGNNLHGSFPRVVCNLSNLYSVDLSQNSFSGEIPRCLGDLSFLGEINLGSNAFTSYIPSSLWFGARVQKMNLSNNFINGSLPQEIGDMKSLVELDLSGNQLSGEIPRTISKLQNLVNLTLSNNKLDGPLYDSFSELKGLEHLDLSHNNLSGQIPKSLESLTYLSYFNVSFNKLSGEIPDEGPFANYTYESFMGNEGLCGAPRFKVEECKRKVPTPTRKTHLLLKYILPPIGSVLVVALILFLGVRSRYAKLSTASTSDVPLRLEHERISYNEILHATSNLDAENLIGKGSFGSVYKGCFSDSIKVAAVKVFDLEVQGALVSFDTECQILRSIRHRNLVKVITCCSNVDFKALVLAFMPNGNLEKWLYYADFSLNIFQRFKIMVDVATALEYLHDGYSSPIVHCDLKPQNILLDEGMVAHVGDFGIAKLLTQEQRIHQTRTLGTIGYIAPEYGSEGLVSTMVDVYSYGILVMEMCSRRKPSDEMFCGELSMRKWMQESFPSNVMEVVDKELVNIDDQRRRVEYEKCLSSTIELALACTAEMPEVRPSMKDVVVKMNKINSDLLNRIRVSIQIPE